LRAAGIDKRDGRGWTVDVHALRTTFGTLLSKGGVSLRTAQEAMRHSDPALTANVYTDPHLLDVIGALDALPTLPLDAKPHAEHERLTGTYAVGPLAPTLAPTSDKSRESLSFAGKMEDKTELTGERCERRNLNAKQQLSSADNSSHVQKWSGRKDLNLRPLGPEPSALAKLSYAPFQERGL
jgi:hypothetical protein